MARRDSVGTFLVTLGILAMGAAIIAAMLGVFLGIDEPHEAKRFSFGRSFSRWAA